MNIKTILKQECISTEIEDVNPSCLTFNSKDVVENTLFICKGQAFKRDYLLDAMNRGAIAYCSEVDYDVEIPLILVKDIRKAMIQLGNEFYQYPQNHLKLIGVTGTKGKTTTAYLIKELFKDEIGLISSIEVFDGKETKPAVLTTPEYLDILKILRTGVDAGLDKFVLEVSSQALKVNRVDGLVFDYGIFLNISPDHISAIEHPDFEDYFHSKLRLFKQSKTAVINLEADHIDEILEAAKESENIITFGSDADYNIHDIDPSSTFFVNEEQYNFNMHGLFNIENKTAVIIIGKELGLTAKEIDDALFNVRIPGRMELFKSQDENVKVIVDYAHNTLSSVSLFKSVSIEYPNHKIFIIFGCPGEKAINRREDLGVIANQYADKVFLCSEDPNFDEPTEISKDIARYLTDVPYEIIDDRKEAFLEALNQSKEKTVILFTGKGDETFQTVKGQSVRVQSDVSIVKEALNIKDH